MVLYTIEIQSKLLFRKSAAYIHTLKDNPSLFAYIVDPKDQRVKKCTYSEFCTIATTKQEKRSLGSITEVESESDSEQYYQSEEIVVVHTMSKLEFLKTAAVILLPFNGKANDLDAFIQNVKLIETVAEGDLKPFCLDFIKGRISGSAGAACNKAKSVDEIIRILRSVVKKDSAKIIESKLDALYFDYKNLSDFAAEADKLGSAFVNSLVAEGCSHEFANKFAIGKMTEICRKSARSSSIKCILAAAQYDSYTDVLTKFRTEIAAIKLEQGRQNYSNNNGSNNQHRNNFSNVGNSNTRSNSGSGTNHRNNNQHNSQNNYYARNNNQTQVRVINESENDESTRWSPPLEMESDNQ